MNELLAGLLLIVPIALVATLLLRGSIRLGGRSNGSRYASCPSCGTLSGGLGLGGGQCPNCSGRN